MGLCSIFSSLPALVVVACKLLHRKSYDILNLPQKFMSILSVIVSDMYSIRVSILDTLEFIKFHLSLKSRGLAQGVASIFNGVRLVRPFYVVIAHSSP